MPETIDAAIALLRKQLDEIEAKASSIKQAINVLCDSSGKPPLFADVDSRSSAGVGTINADRFYGQVLSTSIRDYLEMRRASSLGAGSVSDIYAALVQGGFRFESKSEDNAKRIIRITLTKNTAQFHRLPNGTYGLTTWYPNVKDKPAAKEETGGSETDDAEKSDNVAEMKGGDA